MKYGTLTLGFALVALASIGCGRPLAGSCTASNGGTVIQCLEYREGYVTDQVRAGCPNSANSMFSTDECTPANRVGRCEVILSALGVSVGQTIHYYPPTSAAMAMSDCGQRSAGGANATFSAN